MCGRADATRGPHSLAGPDWSSGVTQTTRISHTAHFAMLNRVIFLSQPRAEAMRPPRDTALISITDTARPPAALREGWSEVLRLSFDDIDPVTYPDDGFDEEYAAMREIHAYQLVELAEFCRSAFARNRRLVVHCRYGQSRSAGVAKAICEAMDLPFPAWYADHNTFVYRTVLGALRHALARDRTP